MRRVVEAVVSNGKKYEEFVVGKKYKALVDIPVYPSWALKDCSDLSEKFVRKYIRKFKDDFWIMVPKGAVVKCIGTNYEDTFSIDGDFIEFVSFDDTIEEFLNKKFRWEVLELIN